MQQPSHSTTSTVFLVDVDNTLLDNDRIQDDIRDHLEREHGVAVRDRYWTIQEELFEQLGYRDYLGALQCYRVEHPYDVRLPSMSILPDGLSVCGAAVSGRTRCSRPNEQIGAGGRSVGAVRPIKSRRTLAIVLA